MGFEYFDQRCFGNFRRSSLPVYFPEKDAFALAVEETSDSEDESDDEDYDGEEPSDERSDEDNDWRQWSKTELQTQLREMGLSDQGKKSTLVKRLRSALDSDDGSSGGDDADGTSVFN